MDLQLHPTTLIALVTLTAGYGLFWSAVLGSSPSSVRARGGGPIAHPE